MKYNIALNTIHEIDIETIALNAQAGKAPSHIMWEMSKILKAKIYQPFNVKILPQDKILAKIIGIPEYWALARQLSEQLTEDDVIYCDAEPLGIAIAHLCSKKQKRPKIAVLFYNMNRPRGYFALNLLKLANSIDLFVTATASQKEFLQHYLGLPEHRICKIPYHPSTDTSFFKPKPISQKKVRPLIASGGLEQRDYKTLANATKDLNIDVKICTFSANKKACKTFPKVIPNNMSCDFYEWQDLVQLYCDADLVVVPLLKNNYQAGLSTLLEAMACRIPVVITRSPKLGIINHLIDSGIVTGVKTGDDVELKQAIQTLLDNPQKAEYQAQLGYEYVINKHNHQKYIQDLGQKLISTFGNTDEQKYIVNPIKDELQQFSCK